MGGNPDNWLDVKNNLQLLSEKRHYSNLKYGYARGYEAYQYVENIRRYMNSIVNYHRVQETKRLQQSKCGQKNQRFIELKENKEKKMLKRKTFLKKKTSRDISASRNLRLRRLKHRKAKQFQRHALQLVIQDI